MGKKYIVELGRCERLYKAFIDGNGKPELAWLSPEIDLTPYIEPDLEQVRKEAYEEGKKQAKVQAELDVCHDIEKVAKENYKAGLADAWEAARKIHRMPDGDILDLFPDCYASVCTAAQAILKYDASEAIDKIRQYDQEQEEIKVGDEVEWNGDRYVVTYIDVDETYVDVIDCSCGSVCDRLAIKGITKTGRHFHEIATVLEKMRGEKE